jgi:hypothetical protein
MIYELYLEGQLADIRQDLGMQLSYAIDDINKYGSRETSFSKTIVLPGTANNNRLLGFVGELGSNNGVGFPNIGANFNPAQTTKAELRANGLLLLKGVFRLTGVVKDGELIEYEGNLFGELGGFISAIGNDKLENLDFNEYNHQYTFDNIVGSWDGKVTRDVNGYFNFNFIGRDEIGVYGYNLNLQVGDIIIITNADTVINNGTYTVQGFSYIASSSLNVIEVSDTLSDDSNDDFTIQYPLNDGSYGKGYFYPLIDYGGYKYTQSTTSPFSYSYQTFRPALFVKEYIDKIFTSAGYTYESTFFNTAFFKRLIIPNNTDTLKKIVTKLLDASAGGLHEFNDGIGVACTFNIINLIDNFSGDGSPNFTYTGTATDINIDLNISGVVSSDNPPGSFDGFFEVKFFKNNTLLYSISAFAPQAINGSYINTISIGNGDTLRVEFHPDYARLAYNITLKIESTNPVTAPIELGDDIIFSDILPRNILQKDFFSWIMKMFNLYITEDKIKENHLFIEPYKDYYDLTEYEDWTYKVERDKPWNIKPMGMLNGRFFEYKYKEDNDFYNEGYKKKFNQSYGDRLHDTGFPFAKDKETTEIGFSPSVLIKYTNNSTVDQKIVAAIYKRSKGNQVDQEERMDSNIRIMQVKRVGVGSTWRIGEPTETPGTYNNIGTALSVYGYAGHFDDPVNPAIDINFGAASEIFFTPNSYPTNNLFNTYWSGYIAEIADKDSKLLTCHVYLTELDIAQLDFSKPVFIDGSLWRINKIMDFDASAGELTKVELLKVINNG